MSDRAISHGFAALFVSVPILGLLFFSVPWEADPRTENPEQRYQRLKNPRQAYLIDAVMTGAPMVIQGADWDGLFSWRRDALRRLESQIGIAPKVTNEQPSFEARLEKLGPTEEGLNLLLKEGSDFNLKLKGGVTPIEVAISLKNLGLLKALLVS